MPTASSRTVDVRGGAPLDVLLEVRADVSKEPLKRNVWLEAGPYLVRLAVSEKDRMAAYRLRFVVFNLELNEGLESAYRDGYDIDQFDAVCDHLIVEHRETHKVVGTYRLQTGDVAAKNFGYYGEQEFDFTSSEPLRSQIVELGRACMHRDHRSTEVLNLLWKGIARYVIGNGGRYMIGCCSLPSLDNAVGHAIYKSLKNCMVAPKLLRAYLTIGAKICGEPAIDWEFKTIDFLTLLDLQTLHPRVAARFLEGC
jgi:putative hemolysin